jgi:UDP-N-acetylmuramyl tripeptide synthase
MKKQNPTIISITGTKGKTTVSNILFSLLREKKNEDVLLVDTEGVYFNNTKKETFDDSWKLYHLVPTVSPGRFLYHLQYSKSSTAILEMSIGSSNLPGMGYQKHSIGVLLNIFEDHIGVRVKSRKELADHKAMMVFGRLQEYGYAIYNADDSYIAQQLHHIPKDKNITSIPFGINMQYLDRVNHLKRGGMYITLQDNWIVSVTQEKITKIIQPSRVSWTFQSQYQPSLYNLMAIIAILHAYHFGKNPLKKTINALEISSIPEEKARLLRFQNFKKEYDIIVDYAHEKYSLKEIAGLARNMTTNKTIGIVRFSHDRSEKQLKDYAKSIANIFDVIIVYNRSMHAKKKIPTHESVERVTTVGDIVFQEIQKHANKKTLMHRTQKESEALFYAKKIATKGDVIVHISNKHEKSIQLVKKILL